MTNTGSFATYMVDAVYARTLMRFVDLHFPDQRELILDSAAIAVISASEFGENVGARLVLDAFERGASVARRQDFGLMYADWVSLRDLGARALLWEQYATIADLIDGASKYINVENAPLSFSFDRSRYEARITYALRPELSRGAEQFMEAITAIGLKTLRNIVGPTWRPIRIELQHPVQSSKRQLHQYFRCQVEFEEAGYSIVFDPADLRVRRGDQDEKLVELISRYLDEKASTEPGDLVSDARRAIAWLIQGGYPTLQATAIALGLTPRTLQRRLRAAGTDFGLLLIEVRIQLAESYLSRPGARPISQLAQLLAFSEPSAVSRFVKQHLKKSPRDLRNHLSDAAGTER